MLIIERIAEVITEGDGYFTYLGLKPGEYTAEIDTEQMENLDYLLIQVKPLALKFR